MHRNMYLVCSILHFGIVGLDGAFMFFYRGTLSPCPDQLRGWVYGQFLIHFWAGCSAANNFFSSLSGSRNFARSLLFLFVFVWFLYALFVGYRAIECATDYPLLYSMVVSGALVLGCKTGRECRNQAQSEIRRPLLSVVVVPRPVPYETVRGDALNDKCSFCIEEFADNDMVVLLPCKHAYHPKVIREWLATSPTCPLCRKDVEMR